MLIRPIVVESNSDDGRGHRFYQKKVLVKGVGLQNAGRPDPVSEFFDQVQREYHADKQREDLLAEQRRLDQVAESLRNENNFIGDILSVAGQSSNYDLPEMIGLVQPSPLNRNTRRKQFEEQLQQHKQEQDQSLIGRALTVDQQSAPPSHHQTASAINEDVIGDEIAIDAILRNIFGDKAKETSGT
jgi:uncharacterized protein YktA (UPF0223 family)